MCKPADDKTALDSFFQTMGLPVVLRAGREFREHGRGMLLFGFNASEEQLFSGRYVPLNEARAAGFSREFVAAVEGYDAERECVVFLNMGTHAKLLRLTLDSENRVIPTWN